MIEDVTSDWNEFLQRWEDAGRDDASAGICDPPFDLEKWEGGAARHAYMRGHDARKCELGEEEEWTDWENSDYG